MKTVVNKTRKPLKVRLRGGKTLHLGPMKSGQISDQASEEDSVKKLVEAGELEIAGEGAQALTGGSSGGSAHDTHGHPPTTVVLPKGNR